MILLHTFIAVLNNAVDSILNFFSRLNKPEDFSSRTVLIFNPEVILLWLGYFVVLYLGLPLKIEQLVLNFVQTQRH